jgi:hypothetical protein
MEKVIIFLYRPKVLDVAQFQRNIEDYLKKHEKKLSAIHYALADDDVAPAHAMAMVNSLHPKDAMISVWYEPGFDVAHFIEGIKNITEHFQAYAVQENVPLKYDAPLGRVNGMCQIALLKKPAHLNHAQWLDIWLNSHTQIAIDTQSTFSYRQNVVVDTYQNPSQPVYDAIVEEQFPAAAMTNRAVFFNGEHDVEKYKANEQKMIESCLRFIDFNAFECMPMSEYRLK